MNVTNLMFGGTPRADSRRVSQRARAPAPHQGAPTSGHWWGAERNDLKIADFVKESSNNHKFSGALRAHIVSFHNVCLRRAPIFFYWKFGLNIRF